MPWPFFRLDLMNRGNPQAPVVIGVAEDPAGAALPGAYRLGPARPNPFNPATSFDLEVPANGDGATVSVRVYDVAGRLVRTLLESPLAAGRHRLSWDGRDGAARTVQSGMFFIHAQAPGFEVSRKILLLK